MGQHRLHKHIGVAKISYLCDDNSIKSCYGAFTNKLVEITRLVCSVQVPAFQNQFLLSSVLSTFSFLGALLRWSGET